MAGGRIGSRVVLVGVPAGWGGSAVLQQFAAVASAGERPVVLVAQVGGNGHGAGNGQGGGNGNAQVLSISS